MSFGLFNLFTILDIKVFWEFKFIANRNVQNKEEKKTTFTRIAYFTFS